MKTTNSGRAFTLIELLLVVGILAILISIMMPAYKTMVEKGKAARCAANLKQLYFSTMNFLVASGNTLPRSQSVASLDPQAGKWFEGRGWVAWEAFPASGMVAIPTTETNNYWQSDTTLVYSNIVKGTLFSYTGLTMEELKKGRSIYFCPTATKYAGANLLPVRTYVMNLSMSSKNMYGLNAAVDVLLFSEGIFSGNATPAEFASTNDLNRMHAGKSVNAVHVDGHVGRYY